MSGVQYMSTKPKCVLFCRPICDISRQIDFQLLLENREERKNKKKTRKSRNKVIFGLPGISPYCVKNKIFQLYLEISSIEDIFRCTTGSRRDSLTHFAD